jgi:hypothetical protein
MSEIALPRSCASCGQTSCKLNVEKGLAQSAMSTTSFVLDEVWPEFARHVAAIAKSGDQLLAPGVFGKAAVSRYRWGKSTSHAATWQTLRRHFFMRSVASKPGAVRQQTYLKHDQLVAEALAKYIDYRARHLVVAQTWLPWLHKAGVLGGRSYDVVMSRYPINEIHRRLDEAAGQFAGSGTISDFRASAELLDLERLALSAARNIITPHHGVASLYPGKAVLLEWQRPAATHVATGRRVAFLGPTIARQRIDIVREIARRLPEPLVVFGNDLEGCDFWSGIPIERRQRVGAWMADLGAIIHPASMTTQPRVLLQAIAQGVKVYAGDGCGLKPGDYLPVSQFR